MSARSPQTDWPNTYGDALRCPACDGSSDATRLVVEQSYRLRRCTTCRTQFLRDERPAVAAST